MAELPHQTYTDAQLDGYACIDCGEQGDVMVPAGEGPRGQLFRHESHQNNRPAMPVRYLVLLEDLERRVGQYAAAGAAYVYAESPQRAAEEVARALTRAGSFYVLELPPPIVVSLKAVDNG